MKRFACAILGVGRALDLRVVAEGVETPEQLEFLRRNNCPLAQGYLFSRPMPAGEMLAWSVVLDRLAG